MLWFDVVGNLSGIDLPPEKESSFNVRLEAKKGGNVSISKGGARWISSYES